MKENNHDLLVNLLILVTGLALILYSKDIEITSPSLFRVSETIGISLSGYAPIRLMMHSKSMFDARLTSKLIDRNFLYKVREVESIKDLPIFIALDIEGCITPPYRTQIDLRKFQRLRGYCDYVKCDNEGKFPPIVIYTGRSQGYVELLAQALGTTDNNNLDLPYVIENGSALYYPVSKKTEILITPEQRKCIQETHRLLADKLPNNEFEPKVCMVTINTVAGEETIDELRQEVWSIINDAKLLDKLIISSTASAVDITIRNFDKFSGLKRVLDVYYKLRPENMGKGLEHVVTVADSTSDLCVIKGAGNAYCPSQEAHPEICEFIEKTYGHENIIDSSQIDFVMEVIERETGLRVI